MRTVVTVDGNGKTEDNGVTVEVDRSFGKHITVIGLYERSLIQAVNVTRVGVTWTWRTPHPRL